MKQLLLALCIVASAAIGLSAADVTGSWELELNPDFGGHDDVRGCSLKQDGDKLTADCGAGPNILGRVDGRRVTFVVKTGRNEEYAATFAGDLDSEGITIAGAWTLTDQGGKREGKFKMRKH